MDTLDGYPRQGNRRLLLAIALFGVVAAFGAGSSAHAQVSPNNELRGPAGSYAGDTPKGWVIVVHGGGWFYVGKEAVVQTRPYARFFRNAGWGTYNVDYRAGSASYTDVVSAYQALRAKVGASATICVAGGSAGGQLALLLAAAEGSGIACVISEAGPTDFLTYAHEAAYASVGQDPFSGPLGVMTDEIEPAFGSTTAQLWRWSPVRVADQITARVLMGASTYDGLVPQAQMFDFERVHPLGAQELLLAGADTTGDSGPNFPHASVTASALAEWQNAELALLTSEVSAAGT